MPAHRMPANATTLTHRKVRLNQLRQLMEELNTANKRAENSVSSDEVQKVTISCCLMIGLFNVFEILKCVVIVCRVVYSGCVRLASLGLPRGAHSGEPLTRAKRTITLALSR